LRAISPRHAQGLTPRTVHTEYSIHRVQHTLSTTYTVYFIIRRLTVSRSQPVFHLSAEHVVHNSLHSHDYELTNELSLSTHRASHPSELLTPDWPPTGTSPISLDCGSKCFSTLAQSHPTTVSLYSHSYSLQVGTITTLKCIPTLPRSRPPRVSADSLVQTLQVYL